MENKKTNNTFKNITVASVISLAFYGLSLFLLYNTLYYLFTQHRFWFDTPETLMAEICLIGTFVTFSLGKLFELVNIVYINTKK